MVCQRNISGTTSEPDRFHYSFRRGAVTAATKCITTNLRGRRVGAQVVGSHARTQHNKDTVAKQFTGDKLAAVGSASIKDHKLAALSGVLMGVGATVAISYTASYLTSCVTIPVASWLKDPSFNYVGSSIRGILPRTTADWVIGGVKGLEFTRTKAAYEAVKGTVSYVTPDFIENLFTYTPSEAALELAKQSLTQSMHANGPLTEEAAIALERVTREKFLASAPWYHTACDKALNGLGMLATAKKIKRWGKHASVGAVLIPRVIGLKKGVALDLLFVPLTVATISKGVSEFAKDPLHAIDKEDDLVVKDIITKKAEKVQQVVVSAVIPSKSKLTGETTAGRKIYNKAYDFAKTATTAFLCTSLIPTLAPYALPLSLAFGAGVTYLKPQSA